jgi:hypothetical protein
MKKEIYALRLEPETVEQIKKVAVEGNVSQWIRLLIKKELEKGEK